eukprot:2104244-Pleurochrysis_carterae.AAC.3
MLLLSSPPPFALAHSFSSKPCLHAVQNRVSFHPLLRTLSSMRVHLQAYAGQLLVMQTDGSPPANDRLKF